MKLLGKLLGLRLKVLQLFSGPQRPIVLVLLIAEFLFALILIRYDCSHELVTLIVNWMSVLALVGLCLSYLIHRGSQLTIKQKRPENSKNYEIKSVIEFNQKARGLSLGRENGVIQTPNQTKVADVPPVSETPLGNEPDNE